MPTPRSLIASIAQYSFHSASGSWRVPRNTERIASTSPAA